MVRTLTRSTQQVFIGPKRDLTTKPLVLLAIEVYLPTAGGAQGPEYGVFIDRDGDPQSADSFDDLAAAIEKAKERLVASVKQALADHYQDQVFEAEAALREAQKRRETVTTEVTP